MKDGCTEDKINKLSDSAKNLLIMELSNKNVSLHHRHYSQTGFFLRLLSGGEKHEVDKFKKFMVEKYYSFEPPISKEEFCKNHSRPKIDIADFEEWLSLYENSKRDAIAADEESKQKKNKNKSSSKKKLTLKPNCEPEKIKKERNRLSHLNQIRYFKRIVRTGKLSFSKDPRKQKCRVQMFLEKENPFKIDKLALILAEDLNDAEFKIDLLLEELKKQNLDIC